MKVSSGLGFLSDRTSINDNDLRTEVVRDPSPGHLGRISFVWKNYNFRDMQLLLYCTQAEGCPARCRTKMK